MTVPIGPAAATGAAAGAAVGGAITDAREAAGNLPGLAEISAARAWMANRHNWVRVGWFVGGLVLMIAGAVTFAERATGGAGTKIIKEAIPG